MSSTYIGLLSIYAVKKIYAGHVKYMFDQTQVDYLGHIIGNNVAAIDPAKARAIMDWPEPTCIKHIKRLLVLTNYYNHFV